MSKTLSNSISGNAKKNFRTKFYVAVNGWHFFLDFYIDGSVYCSVICYAANVNNNAYNNNQWFGYTQLFNVSIFRIRNSISNGFDARPFVEVSSFRERRNEHALFSIYIHTEREYKNIPLQVGTMQFKPAISALLERATLFYIYIFIRKK